MILTLAEIAEYCGGKLYGDGSVKVEGFFTDSRQAEKGKMFVAIKGEKTDGHKYIPNVIEKGCNACFSQIPLDCDINYVLVDNSVAALQKCGKNCREKIKTPVIGITGSVGKTTTKEIISLVLSKSMNVLKTEGNANGQIGLPQMIMKYEPQHEICVFEMGMSMPGEMKKLADMAKPNICVMTNIGVSHIEFHGTRENIMKEKLHIADYTDGSGALFVNGDDDLLSTLKSYSEEGKLHTKVFTYGTKRDCDFRAIYIEESDGCTHFTFDAGSERHEVMIPVIGRHNVLNALAALSLSEYLGLDINKSIEALSEYKPLSMRGEIKNNDKLTVIDDSYNASPDSMISSLSVLRSYSGRKIAVLSDMLELGSYSAKGHCDVGEAAKGVDFLITVGNDAEYIYRGFGNQEKSRYFRTNAEAIDFLRSFVNDGDTILVKGSRGMHTEEIVKAVLEG